MTPVAKFSTSTSDLAGQRAGDRRWPRGFFRSRTMPRLRLAEHGVQFGGAARIAAARRLDLDDFGAHRGEIARRRRAGDDPAEIEHPNAGERHRPRSAALLARPVSATMRSPKGGPGALTVRPPISIGRQNLRCASCGESSCSAGSRSGKLGTCAACAMSAIDCLSYCRLHADISACSASQLATRSGFVAKRGSLPQSGEPITASQAAHWRSSRGEIAAYPSRAGRIVTVAPLPSVEPLARPASAGEPGARQFGDRQGRQRFLDRDVDDGAGLGRQHRVHAGAGGGEPADKGGLLADRADRRFGEIIDLAGQHPGDAAGEEQVRSVAGSSAFGPVWPNGEI